MLHNKKKMETWMFAIVGVLVLLLLAWYFGFFGGSSSSSAGGTGSGKPGPVDGSSNTTVSASSISHTQSSYSIQFWIFVQDWAYKYGEEKPVLKRVDASGNVNPEIVLHPTDNTMLIRVSYLPAHVDASEHGYTTYDCEIPHIPLQTWTAVSVSLNQRNLDVYLNGKLLKTCLIPGAPVNLGSDIQVGAEGGFQGQVSDISVGNTSLMPTDAMAYFQKGSSAPASSVGSNNPIRRYQMKFSLIDPY
jgi:hypothetical protein